MWLVIPVFPTGMEGKKWLLLLMMVLTISVRDLLVADTDKMYVGRGDLLGPVRYVRYQGAGIDGSVMKKNTDNTLDNLG